MQSRGDRFFCECEGGDLIQVTDQIFHTPQMPVLNGQSLIKKQLKFTLNIIKQNIAQGEGGG